MGFFVKNRFYSYALVLMSLFVAACSAGSSSYSEGDVIRDKVVNIENDPVTQLFFVPVNGEADDGEILIYKDGDALGEVEPAAGYEVEQN